MTDTRTYTYQCDSCGWKTDNLNTYLAHGDDCPVVAFRRVLHDVGTQVRRLDLAGDLDELDTVTIWTKEHTGGELRAEVARSIAHILGRHYGPGSWVAAHHLRQITVEDVAVMLRAWGAAPFTIEVHAERISQWVHSFAPRGGAQ